MFIVIFPYLPGSDSPVFQGVSVLLGFVILLWLDLGHWRT